MMLASDLRLPQYGFAALRRPGPVGSIFSKVTKAISNAFEDVADEAKRTWDRIRAEARRTGNRVGDTLEKAVHDISSRDWWANTVARTVARVAAVRLLVAIASFVYPPIALVAETIQEFLARWKAEDVGTPEFWAVAEKDGVNEFLAEVVVEMNKIDLFQTLPTLAMSELTIQAQDSREKRDALRMETAAIQAKWAQTEWAVVARHAFQAAQAIVIEVVTLGAGTFIVAIIELGQMLISAATTALQMQQMREVMKIAKDQQRERKAAEQAALALEMQRLEAEIAALNAEIAAMGGTPVLGGTTQEALAAEGAPDFAVAGFKVTPAVIGAALLVGGVVAYAAA